MHNTPIVNPSIKTRKTQSEGITNAVETMYIPRNRMHECMDIISVEMI